MSPSVLSSYCSRFWLNKDSDHKTKQRGSQATAAANDSLCGLAKLWGMRNNDTLIKCDEANGQCVVACSRLSVSKKHNIHNPPCNLQGQTHKATPFVIGKGLLSASTAGNVRGINPSVQDITVACFPLNHCSFPTKTEHVDGHIMPFVSPDKPPQKELRQQNAKQGFTLSKADKTWNAARVWSAYCETWWNLRPELKSSQQKLEDILRETTSTVPRFKQISITSSPDYILAML